MENIVGARIKALRKEKGYTQESLAAAMRSKYNLKTDRAMVGKWEIGFQNPEMYAIKCLSEILGVSMDYLGGNTDVKNTKLDEWINKNMLPYEAGSRIPIIGTIKAGYNGLAFEDFQGYDLADVNNPDEYRFLRVKGDSMEPRIYDGDLALIHLQPEVENGEVAAVIVDGEESTLKKVLYKRDAIVLQAFNSNYPPKILSGDELNDFVIIGKLVEVKSKW